MVVPTFLCVSAGWVNGDGSSLPLCMSSTGPAALLLPVSSLRTPGLHGACPDLVPPRSISSVDVLNTVVYT